MEMERKKYRNTGRNTKRLWTEGRKCDKGVTRRRREEDGGRRGWETLECNLKSFLVKLRETRAATQTWGTKGGAQSGLETMMGTRRPILIMESAQVKPSRFSLPSLTTSFSPPPGPAISIERTPMHYVLCVATPLYPPPIDLPLDSRKISTDVELRFDESCSSNNK